ncbi:MAG: hypothetical protein ACJ8JD_02015, partial [Chthoniobacterales bacterium]
MPTLGQGRSPFSFVAFTTLVLALCAPKAGAAIFNVINGDVTALKAAITTARSNNEDDTINLSGVFVLSAVDNSSFGPSGLPVLGSDSGHSVTINGNGATFQRDTGSTPDFRILVVDQAHVTIDGLTFDNGIAQGPNLGVLELANFGGGLLNREGSVTLTNCTFTRCSAVAGAGACNASQPGAAHLTVRACTLNRNPGSNPNPKLGAGLANVALDGGHATATVENTTFDHNDSLQAGSALVSYASGGGKSHVDIDSCTLSDQQIVTLSGHTVSAVTADAASTATVTIGNSIIKTTLAGGGEL